MRPGRAWVTAPTGFDGARNDRNIANADSTNNVCRLARHTDRLRRELTAAAYNPGQIAADVRVTFIGGMSDGSRVPDQTVRIEPGRIVPLSPSLTSVGASFTGGVRLESTQPIVPGGETRVFHEGTQDVLTSLYAAAPLVWFELTPQQVQPPAPGPGPGPGQVAPTG